MEENERVQVRILFFFVFFFLFFSYVWKCFVHFLHIIAKGSSAFSK